MKCSKCGNEIPSQSRFCLTCGESIISNRTTNISEAPESRKKKTGLWAAITGLAIVAIILALKLHGMRVTQATPVPNPQQTPVVNAVPIPGGPQPNVLDTNVEKTPEEKPEPPADVVAYLEHLKKVEQTRMALQEREISTLSVILTKRFGDQWTRILKWSEDEDNTEDAERTPQEEISRDLSALSRDWQLLARYFLSVQPPAGCQDLYTKYYSFLIDVISTMGKLQDLAVKGDLNVMQMQGKSGHIDEKLISADQELAKVCNQYGIDKSFSIQSDSSQTPLLGF